LVSFTQRAILCGSKNHLASTVEKAGAHIYSGYGEKNLYPCCEMMGKEL